MITGQDLLIGKWRESKETIKRYKDGKLEETTVEEASDTNYVELEFRVDGTFSEFESDSYGDGYGGIDIDTYSNEGTYEVNNSKVVTTYASDEGDEGDEGEEGEEGEVNEGVAFSLSENVLTI